MTDKSSARVALVDATGREIGTAEKMEAHREGLLHRAFSIFIFNSRGEMLLQRRAEQKYHSGGLWSNACCSHPTPGEDIQEAGLRRLHEELGFSCELKEAFTFTYRAEVGSGLIEHEFDHVLFGVFEGEIRPDPAEVEDIRWIQLSVLKSEMIRQPAAFSEWFKIALRETPASRLPTWEEP